MICKNISVSESGRLLFAGQDTVQLAEKYGTPVYLMDEDRIRENCRTYKQAMLRAFGTGGVPIYASKACSFKHIYSVMAEEEMSVDAVSCGEIYTAFCAGFPMELVVFHGNNKTDADIRFAMEHSVGWMIADGFDELLAIDRIAGEKNIIQRVLLRLTPGIDPHTYEEVATGKVDSKFGVAIETGQAEEFLKASLSCKNISVQGFHCHVGSQVFDDEESVYDDSADKMLSFCAEMQTKYSFQTQVLNLGGGYAVRYVESDKSVDIAKNISLLAKHIRQTCEKLELKMPVIALEPGRSIVADAGMTLYSVGTVKQIPGYKNYVSIDGGMTDNPRYALYGSQYTVYCADRMNDAPDFVCDLVGRCCESGDIIQPDVTIPRPKRGDLIAVCTTGAYNYSMASNYNRVPRPPVVMLKNGESSVAVRRETLADLIQNDV